MLNLLLDTDLLPYSLLCATSTICRLHNSNNKRFEIISKDNKTIQIEVDNDDPHADKKMKEKLEPYVSNTENRNEHQYKQLEIYWPTATHSMRHESMPGCAISKFMSNLIKENVCLV